ncbi:MAG: hypothetical protein GX053_12770 [Tissierella sp.]|nr:hypothetical protein [Tissierella sp.]
MNVSLLRLIGILKEYGELNTLMEDTLTAFADTNIYPIVTITDLKDALEDEISYWEE